MGRGEDLRARWLLLPLVLPVSHLAINRPSRRTKDKHTWELSARGGVYSIISQTGSSAQPHNRVCVSCRRVKANTPASCLLPQRLADGWLAGCCGLPAVAPIKSIDVLIWAARSEHSATPSPLRTSDGGRPADKKLRA